MHAALAMRPSLRLFASPWSPPAYMKRPLRNGTRSRQGSALPNGLRDEMRPAWAAYLSRAVAAWANASVPLWAITVQACPRHPSPPFCAGLRCVGANTRATARQRTFAMRRVARWPLQNEPEFAAPWDACAWTAEYTRDFVAQYLGPRLAHDHSVTPRPERALRLLA